LRNKYGPVRAHGVSINSDYDLEMWLYGDITRAWLAVELLLNKETGKIRAVGILQGEVPSDAPTIAVSDRELPSHLDKYLRLLATEGYFTGTVLVAHKGRPIYEGAFGIVDEADGASVHMDTRFQLVSVTKPFTAIAIAQLVERGKLSFEDPIGAYVPEYPKDIAEQVTVGQLLTHTSGIELDAVPGFLDAKRAADDSEALLQVHLLYIDSLRTDGRFERSGEYDYTNEGFDLAGLIIERVSGQTLLAYFSQNIFEPAGMLRSGRFAVDPAQGNVAIGYTHYVDRSYAYTDVAVPNTAFLDAALFGSSGLYSTVGDLNRFANALFYSSVLLSSDVRDVVHSPQVERGSSETYGYGFTLTTYNNILIIGHSGSMPGGSTEFRYSHDGEHTIIVLASKRTIATAISNYIRGLLVHE